MTKKVAFHRAVRDRSEAPAQPREMQTTERQSHRYWISRREEKAAWQAFNSSWSKLEEGTRTRLVTAAISIYRQGKLIFKEMPDFCEAVRNFVIGAGRGYIEDGVTAEGVITTLQTRTPEVFRDLLQPFRGPAHMDRIKRFLDLALPYAAAYSLYRLSQTTEGVETKVWKLVELAEREKKLDPERAKTLLECANDLSEDLPNDFVWVRRRRGRPRINPWKLKLFVLLFDDNMPTIRIGKLLGQTPASIRRLRRKYSSRE